jgi:hypothetical protein
VLPGTTVDAIQIPPQVADDIAAALRDADGDVERTQAETRQRLEQRRRAVLAKLDRGYDDLVSGRISEAFWTRKSAQWEQERHIVEGELRQVAHGNSNVAVTGEKILELAKKAGFLYQTQDPKEQRRLLETLLFELHL